jgi:hypothetical protein
MHTKGCLRNVRRVRLPSVRPEWAAFAERAVVIGHSTTLVHSIQGQLAEKSRAATAESEGKSAVVSRIAAKVAAPFAVRHISAFSMPKKSAGKF